MGLVEYLLIAIIILMIANFTFWASSPADKMQFQTVLQIREDTQNLLHIREDLEELNRKLDSIELELSMKD